MCTAKGSDPKCSNAQQLGLFVGYIGAHRDIQDSGFRA